MKREDFLKDNAPIEKSQVLSDEMLASVESGEKCQTGCKKNCQTNKKSA